MVDSYFFALVKSTFSTAKCYIIIAKKLFICWNSTRVYSQKRLPIKIELILRIFILLIRYR